MKKILFLSVIFLFTSCKKNIKTNTNVHLTTYQVENFRKPGMDDYQTITAALDSIPENSTLQFANKTYTLSHTPYIQKSINFIGPATITRENQITYTLTQAADKNSSYLILNSTDGILTGSTTSDRFIVCLDNTGKGATALNYSIKASGDTLFLYGRLGTTNGGAGTFPAGTKLFKSINLFSIFSPIAYPNPGWYPDMNCSFTNLTFDGNRDNNKGSYYWNLNSAILALTKGTTTYTNCKIINSPNESIVGHNANIQNCTFENLNGSGFHTSADKENCTEAEIHSLINNSLFENTNQISNVITGHSEGAITHSNSGGYYTATHNTFNNVGDAVIGDLYASVSQYDWGTSDITFTQNTINGAGRMVYFIDTNSIDSIHNVYIGKNIINNVEEYDHYPDLSNVDGIILEQKSGE